jgi:MSHA biogenesis protein MshI
MPLVGRGREVGDWLAVGVYGQRIDIAQVERAAVGRPVVQICESYVRKGSEVESLKSVARAVRPNRFRCSAMLDAADYQMQLVEAPSVPSQEMKSAVRWKLKDLLDYPVDAATVDVADVPTDRSGAARAHYVYAVSARNERIKARMKAFQDAKFPLEAIDVPEMAQRNIATLFEEPGRGLALLAFDDRGGLLTVTADGELFMARHTDVSAAQLTEVRSDMTDPTIERLVLELQRSLDHFDRQFSYISVSRMLVAPLPVDIGLDRHLANSLGLPVQSFDLADVLDFPGAPELRDPTRQGYRLHIIGAALRDERVAS